MNNVEVEVRRRWVNEGKEDLLFHDILFNKRHFEHLYPSLQPYFGEKVLDLGAGCCWFGMLLKIMKPEVEVTSLDVSPDMMNLDRKAAKKMGIPYVETKKAVFDGKQLPFPDRAFSSIFFSAVWHHIQDLPTYLTEVRRILRDDGTVIAINEPCSPMTPGLKQLYNHFFGRETRDEGLWELPRTPAEYTAALKRAGFGSVNIQYDLFKIKRNMEKLSRFAELVYAALGVLPRPLLHRYLMGGGIVVVAKP